MPSPKNVDAVTVLSAKLGKAKAVYFTDYLGLDVVSITQLRKEFVMKDVEFTIAKNTLIKLAAKEAGMSGVDDFLKGPTAMAVSYEDPTNPAQVIKDFLKDFDKPSVKGMILDGEVFDANEFERIANLPSKDQLLSKLVGMLNSPMAKLSSTLGFLVYGLAHGGNGSILNLDKEVGNIAILVGSEGKGLRRLTMEKVDQLIEIPINPDSESLNVSNAASISMFQLQKNILKS